MNTLYIGFVRIIKTIVSETLELNFSRSSTSALTGVPDVASGNLLATENPRSLNWDQDFGQ